MMKTDICLLRFNFLYVFISFLKVYFHSNYVSYVSMCFGCAPASVVLVVPRRGHPSLELELQEVEGHLMWILGTELNSKYS